MSRFRILAIFMLCLMLTGCTTIAQRAAFTWQMAKRRIYCPPDSLVGPPVWSPDSKSIGYITATNSGHTSVVSIANIESGDIHDLTGLSDPAIAHLPAWFSDSQSVLIFGQTRGGSSDFFKVDIETGQVTTLFSLPSEDYISTFNISQDDSLIMYTFHGSAYSPIIVVESNGQNSRRVIEASSRAWLSALSPNGDQIIYQTGSGILSDIAVVTLDNSITKMLMEQVNSHSEFRWSPDGTHIAFLRYDSTTTWFDLMVINIATGEITELTEDVREFAWEADSQWLLHITSTDDIMQTSIDGSRTESLLADHLPFMDNAAFSPDGTQLAYITGYPKLPELYILDLSTGETTQLTDNPGRKLCFP